MNSHLIQTHLFFWHEAPSPNPLPARRLCRNECSCLAAQKRDRQPFSDTFELRIFIFWVNISSQKCRSFQRCWGSSLLSFGGGALKFPHPSACPFFQTFRRLPLFDTVSGERAPLANLFLIRSEVANGGKIIYNGPLSRRVGGQKKI